LVKLTTLVLQLLPV